ncbi:MAG TPA: APC family permease [Candidatus Acidoferrales bacterium]|nr:APC family permease [Candidatus Acidoferrales bacterium]
MTPTNSPSAPGGMLRVLGITFGVAVALGATIGAGIMRTPSQIANRMPSMWLIMLAWAAGALYSLLGAFSLGELGAMIPSSGAFYTIARRAYGDYVGFVVGWTDWVGQCGSGAAAVILAGEYGRDLVPTLSHPILTATIMAGVIALLQWRGIRWGSRFQNVTSAITALVFFGLIAAAYRWPHRLPAVSAPVAMIPTGWPFVLSCVLVLQAVIYTFDGWYCSLYFGDEIKNPGREMPRSMLSGVLLLSAIYLLTNAALFHVLGIAGVAKENLPVAALGASIFGEPGNTAVRALMVLALAALAHSSFLAATRVLYAMSRDGWGARGIARVNQGGTPSVALFLTTCITMVFLLSGSFDRVIAVTTFFFVARYALSYFAVFTLRRREPGTPRPYRAWGYPWTTGAAVAASAAFLVGVIASDTRNSVYSLIVLLASYPVYRLAQTKISPA